MISCLLAWSHYSWRLGASLVLDLRPQELLAGLVCLQIADVSPKNPLFLKVLPFTFKYRLWYRRQWTFWEPQHLLGSSGKNPPLSPRFLPGLGALAVPSLTSAHTAALTAGQGALLASSPGRHSHRLPEDQPIFDPFLNLLTALALAGFLVSLRFHQAFYPQRRTRERRLLWSPRRAWLQQPEWEAVVLLRFRRDSVPIGWGQSKRKWGPSYLTANLPNRIPHAFPLMGSTEIL